MRDGRAALVWAASPSQLFRGHTGGGVSAPIKGSHGSSVASTRAWAVSLLCLTSGPEGTGGDTVASLLTGLWRSVHIDDLRRSSVMVSDVTKLQDTTISQLFDPASESECTSPGEVCGDTGLRAWRPGGDGSAAASVRAGLCAPGPQ